MKEIWLSFKEAIIRFWDNRFLSNHRDEIDFLRSQIERERAEKLKLVNFLITPISENNERNELPEPIPGGHKPWAVRKQELEKKFRKPNIGGKTIEELEKEVLDAS